MQFTKDALEDIVDHSVTCLAGEACTFPAVQAKRIAQATEEYRRLRICLPLKEFPMVEQIFRTIGSM